MSDDEIIGWVVDSFVGGVRDSMCGYVIQNEQGERWRVEIPDIFHYDVGDGVYEEHVYNEKCAKCGNERMYDSKEDEMYCPLGHDN